jgi:predicted small metal-binding protein
MPKQLRCADVGFDCDATIDAEDENAVLTQAAQHAKEAHGMTDEDLAGQVGGIRAAIRDT